MAKKMLALPNHAASAFLRSSTYSQSSFFLPSYIRKTDFGQTNMLHRRLCFFCIAVPSFSSYRRMEWPVRSMTDQSNSSDASESSTNNGTRLVRAIRSVQAKLTARVEEFKKSLSVKVLFFLVGFYCATAFPTVIGQTGDWDILSAGLAVVVVEGIGALMYRASFRLLERAKGLITVFNYWKAGLSLGLFLNSFKYEVDVYLESCNLFKFDIDVFPLFW